MSTEVNVNVGTKLTVQAVNETPEVTELTNTDGILIGQGLPSKHISWENFKAPLEALVNQSIIGSATPSSSPTGEETNGQSYRVSSSDVDQVFTDFLDAGGQPITVTTPDSGLLTKSDGSWGFVKDGFSAEGLVKITDIEDNLTSTDVDKPTSANSANILSKRDILAWDDDIYAIGQKVFYNGQIWQAIGATLATDIPGIATNWVSLIDLDAYMSNQDYLESANMYDDSSAESGKFVNGATGGTPANASYAASGFIRVVPGSTVSASMTTHKAFYTINKQYISGNDIVSVTAETYSIPSNAYYLRTSPDNPHRATFMLNKGATLLPFQTYDLKIRQQYIPAQALADGSVTGSKVADKAIAINKTTFLVTGDNIFNINDPDCLLGFYISTVGGGAVANPAYNATGFMKVIAGESYTMSYKHNICWYDINKVKISASASTDTNKTQIAPAGSAYLRCSVAVLNWVTFMVNEGTVLKPYATFGYELKDPEGAPIKVSSDGGSSPINISVPSKKYLLKGEENRIYFEQITDKWREREYYVRVSSSLSYLNYRKFAVLDSPMTGGAINYNVIEGNGFNIISSASSTAVIGDPVTDNGAVVVAAIGDSYLQNSEYAWVIFDRIPNCTFVGMRLAGSEPALSSGIRVEGRGGWRMASYATAVHAANQPFSPFLQAPGFNYFGNTDFWKKVVAGNTGSSYVGFSDVATAIGFDSNGFKTSPAVNDLMWDDVNLKYVYWDGAAWSNSSVTDADFSFDYAKYLFIWGISTPTHVTIELGVNDFRSLGSVAEVLDTYVTFKTQMDAFITAIKSAVSGVKILIMLPPCMFGTGNNILGDFTDMQKYLMFNARVKMIEGFDNRESESIYLVDAGSAVDDEYGFSIQFDQPFGQYAGTETRRVQRNPPHPGSWGYDQFGIPSAACIQLTR